MKISDTPFFKNSCPVLSILPSLWKKSEPLFTKILKTLTQTKERGGGGGGGGGGEGGFQVCCYTLNKKLDCKIQITVNKNFNLKSAINIFSIKRQCFQF